MIEVIRWVVAFTFLMFATYCYALLIYGMGLGILHVWNS
jgi:hypothetical protein